MVAGKRGKGGQGGVGVLPLRLYVTAQQHALDVAVA